MFCVYLRGVKKWGGGGRNRQSSFGHSSGERKLATVA